MYVKALVCLFIQCHLSASSNCSLFSALLSISTSPANEIIKKTVTVKLSWLITTKSVRVSESKCLPFSVLLCENLLQATIANVSMNYYLKLQHYHYFQTRDRRCLLTIEAFSKQFWFWELFMQRCEILFSILFWDNFSFFSFAPFSRETIKCGGDVSGSVAGRRVFGRRPKTRAASGLLYRLDRDRKPHMKTR